MNCSNPDIEILQQDSTRILEIEKIQSKWWLTLIIKETGKAAILVCNTKAIAKSMFKGMSLDEVQRAYKRLGIEYIKMYKANYAPFEGML